MEHRPKPMQDEAERTLEPQFERDIYALNSAGFILKRDVISQDQIDVLLEQFGPYQAEVDAFAADGGALVNPTGWPIKSARAAWAVSKEVQDVIMDASLVDYARAYLGEVFLRDAQFLANMPDPRNVARGTSGKVSYHRDKYWPHDNITPEFLWAFVLLTDMTPDNGGTIVVPGTHKVKEPGYYFLQNDPGEKIESNEYLVYDREYFPSSIQIEAKKGSMILFDPMIIHTQAINVSEQPRRVLNVLFHKRGCRGIMNCRRIAERHARVPIRDDLLTILELDERLPNSYGPLC